MIKRILNYLRDIRINFDYRKHEENCRNKHKLQAEKTYKTQTLEDEVKSINKRIDEEADNLFKGEIERLNSKISNISSDVSSSNEILKLLSRNFKQELEDAYLSKSSLFTNKNEAYSRINVIKKELSEAFESKHEAYETLNDYKDAVDSWYTKSERTPWLFGNAGKKLPKHSPFGQSHGDLDHYKYQRDKAYDDAQEWNEEITHLKQKKNSIGSRISEIKQEIVNLNETIYKIKNDRNHMYELKKEGHEKEKLKSCLGELQSTIKLERRNLEDQQSLRSEFVADKKISYGIIELELKIKKIISEKKEFIESFEKEINKSKRIDDHRIAWLNKHNQD